MRLVGEQLSPVIGGDLERSALPVGVFEWWIENPGPDPLTVGLLFTWADPFAASGPAAPRPHRVVAGDDGSLAVEFARCRGRRADGPAGHARDRRTRRRWRRAQRALDVRSGRRPGALVGLRRRRAAGARGWAIGGRSASGPGVGRGGGGDGRRSSPVSGGRSGSRSRGTCRSSSSARGGSGGSATRRPGAATAGAAVDLARHALAEAPALAPRDRGVAGALPRRPRRGPTGTRWRCSTSCTSWSTAARSGSTARSAGRSPSRTTSAGSRCSSASTTRSTTPSMSTSTRRSRCSRCSPSSSCAGSATCSRRSPSTCPRS